MFAFRCLQKVVVNACDVCMCGCAMSRRLVVAFVSSKQDHCILMALVSSKQGHFLPMAFVSSKQGHCLLMALVLSK